jgi:hypothetical protein
MIILVVVVVLGTSKWWKSTAKLLKIEVAIFFISSDVENAHYRDNSNTFKGQDLSALHFKISKFSLVTPVTLEDITWTVEFRSDLMFYMQYQRLYYLYSVRGNFHIQRSCYWLTKSVIVDGGLIRVSGFSLIFHELFWILFFCLV